MKNKPIRTVTAAASAAALISMFAVNAYAAGSEYGNLLVLGDSITSGFGLEGYVAGDNTSAEDSFANKLAAGDMFSSYQNFAVDGRTSAELLEAVTTNDEYKSAVSDADEIVISIGGNDFLQPMLAAAMGAMMNDEEFMNGVIDGSIPADQAASQIYERYADVIFDSLKSIDLNESEANITGIIDSINSVNSDCDIYILTVYNPFNVDSFGSLDEEAIEEFTGLTEGNLAVMNGSIRTIADNYDNVYVVDVYSEFTGKELELTNIETGDVHPSKDGHEVIYNLLVDSITANSDADSAETEDVTDAAVEPAEEAMVPAAEPETVPEQPETPVQTEAAPAPASDSTSSSAPTGNVPAETLGAAAAVSFAAVLLSRKKRN